MSSTVANLRKSGQLNEAYRLAEEGLRLASDDIWAKRDMALPYDLAKKHSTNAVKEQFLKCMSKRQGLQMPYAEGLFHNKIISLAGAMFFDSVNTDDGFLDSLFSCLQGFCLKRKTGLCSAVTLPFLQPRAGGAALVSSSVGGASIRFATRALNPAKRQIPEVVRRKEKQG